jgi:MFS family permease
MARFFRFNFGNFLSVMGSNLTVFALGILILQSTQSVGLLGLAAVCQKAPAALASLAAGVLIDRFPKKKIILATGIIAFLNTSWLTAYLFAGEFSIWPVLVFLCLVSTLKAFQEISILCSIPGFFGKRDLRAANGKVQVGMGAALMLAPLLGGYLIGRIGMKSIPICELAIMPVSLAVFWSIRFPVISEKQGEARRTSSHRFAAGWDYLWSTPPLKSLLAYLCGVNFLVGSSTILIMPLALKYTDAAGYGWVQGLGTAGMLLGGIVVASWRGTDHSAAALVYLGFIEAALLACAALSSGVWMLAASMFGLQFCFPFFAAHSQSIWQRSTPEALLGRVLSLKQSCIWASLTLAYAVSGFLADQVQSRFRIGAGSSFQIPRIFGFGPGLDLRITLGVLAALSAAWAGWALVVAPFRSFDTIGTEELEMRRLA